MGDIKTTHNTKCNQDLKAMKKHNFVCLFMEPSERDNVFYFFFFFYFFTFLLKGKQ